MTIFGIIHVLPPVGKAIIKEKSIFTTKKLI
jgi:hypothetical protein